MGQLEEPTAWDVDVVMGSVSVVIVAATPLFGTGRFTLKDRRCEYTK